ncbi:hypothetical protein N7539_003079 [Penicillium diatomitis]|uniref:Uncharacterized protein n=1 Tax=Penicillium diatomitis TaxID=2819901 RepID=A0A9W9XH45_9EURO|nr:uncharacterized protein N7539_003079 [Penicillium diatomitis]KAJ5491512.1 hypothetical protein N7539_003079 [Penicillium diatomitis]
MDASLKMLPFLKNFPMIRDLTLAVPPSLVMRFEPNAEALAPRLYQALHDEGFTLIFAGANTVADSRLMGHWHTMRNRVLLANLRREVLAVWPDLEFQPSLSDLESLLLLTATLKESLRLIPSGVSLTRVVPPGDAITADTHIPGGTTVGMAILHVHQATAVGGEDVLDVRPERWFEKTTRSSEARDAEVVGSMSTLRSDLDH